MKNKSIKNGQPWYDTDGNRIHAQFPHISYQNGKYYLYGLNKEESKGNNGIWHKGIVIYESEDMYNFKNLGYIIPPDMDNENSLFNPKSRIDNPNIIYNESTGKYILWICNLTERTAHSFVSDSLFGPYNSAEDGFLPCGFELGDFELAKDAQGRGYLFFNRPHTEIICARLTDDYTNVDGTYTRLLHHPESVPFNREAPTYMYRSGKHYLITSGTTTFFPNPSEVCMSENINSGFENLGNPHIGDTTDTSFHSQIRSIFKVPGKKDLYIAFADRWLPDYMDIPYEVYKKWHIDFHGPNSTAEDKARVEKESKGLIHADVFDVSKAQYVVLPIVFKGDMPTIEWRESWTLEEFE